MLCDSDFHVNSNLIECQKASFVGSSILTFLYGTKPDVSKCQPFGIECWLYVRAD